MPWHFHYETGRVPSIRARDFERRISELLTVAPSVNSEVDDLDMHRLRSKQRMRKRRRRLESRSGAG